MKTVMLISFFILLIFFAINIAIPLAPVQYENEVMFKWISVKNKHIITIDDNKYFSSAMIFNASGNSYKLELAPGIWYWKIDNGLTRKVKINSVIALKRSKDKVKNEGNVKTKITFPGFTGFTFLNPKESTNAGGLLNVTAEQA